MRRAIILGALLLCSAAAKAQVVTFDGVPFGNSPTQMDTYVEGDITVTSLDGSFWALYGPGELHLESPGNGTGNSAFDFTFAGGAFDLVSFDVVVAQGFWGAFLQGFDQNGDLLASLFVTDFGTVPVDGFFDLYTLRITAFGDPGDNFSIDNLTISTQPVPEPGTWLTMLLGFGAIGYGFRRSRVRRSAALNLQA